MPCTNDRYNGCGGYDYDYNSCCDYDDNDGMSDFWNVFLWIMMIICICATCAILGQTMRRRRMQQM